MKEEKLGQEPAFPATLNQVVEQTTYNFKDENGNGQIGHYNNYADISYQGVSKRFYAACAAMQGMLAHSTRYHCRPEDSHLTWKQGMIKEAYELADELLIQEGGL